MALFDMLPSLNGWNKEVKFVTAFYLLVEHPKLQDFLKINDNDKCWVPNWWIVQCGGLTKVTVSNRPLHFYN